jgi:acid phosphatase family membrane protein YuiD
MNPGSLFDNRILIAGMTGWLLAQLLKPPIYYLLTRRWNWGLFFSTGGMPSSHSALVTGVALAVGLYAGFGTAEFAIALAMAMVVVYDAAGVRRQAGFHAQRINLLINELLSGHPISDQRLKEMLGHTPREVVGGVILGLTSSYIIWALWH